jgi:hypothetical protein
MYSLLVCENTTWTLDRIIIIATDATEQQPGKYKCREVYFCLSDLFIDNPLLILSVIFF